MCAISLAITSRHSCAESGTCSSPQTERVSNFVSPSWSCTVYWLIGSLVAIEITQGREPQTTHGAKAKALFCDAQNNDQY